MGVSYIPLSSPSISDNRVAVPAYMSPLQQHNLPLVVKYGFSPGITLDTPTRQVLSYIFAPPDNTRLVRIPSLMVQDLLLTISSGLVLFPASHNRVRSPYDYWGEEASKLEDDNFKAE